MLKCYVSAFGGVGGLNQNADTADAGEGCGVVSDQMLTLLTLGSGGMEKLGQKSKENNTNNH